MVLRKYEEMILFEVCGQIGVKKLAMAKVTRNGYIWNRTVFGQAIVDGGRCQFVVLGP